MKNEKNKYTTIIIYMIIFLVIPAIIYITWRLAPERYYLTGMVIILLSMFIFFVRFERRKPEARELVVLAVICTIAVISRAVFAMIPHFKPMSGIIMIAGLAFGGETGFFVGAVSAFVSNFMFMQGPWTPWQMFAYGVGGLAAGLLGNCGIMRSDKPVRTAVAGCIIVIAVVGPLLDTCALFTMGVEINKASMAVTYGAGLPLNCVHGAATFVTLLLFSKPMTEKLDRMKKKYGIMREE